MTIGELYKLHINPNAGISELMQFYNIFDVCQIYIKNPDPIADRAEQEYRVHANNICKEWILKNSKLKINN